MPVKTHRSALWAAGIFLAGWVHGQNSDYVPHPGYKVTTIRPDNFQPQVCGMDFLPDGKMVVVTWKGSSTPMWQSNGGKWGQAYILDGVDGADRNAVKVTKIADGFKDAMGVVVVNGEIYVGDVDRVVKLTNKDAAGVYQGKQEIGKYPSSPDGWFEYSFGPVFKDNKFYMALAVHVTPGGTPTPQKSIDRSSLISIPLEGGNYQVVASGLRAPDGIGFGPGGEIFVTDNQGGWEPTSKIINVEAGRNYGYVLTPPGKFQSLPMTQPTLWLPYGTISHSPTELHAMKAGIFKGQMFFGDVSRGGLYRAFLEEVNDPVTGKPEYQGAVFPFTGNKSPSTPGGLEAGIHRLKIKDNGDIYVGGLGNGELTNKGWLGSKFGLQKITALPGAAPFEMLALRSRKSGMEIEFTQPVGPSGESAANYKLETWNYIPVETYGGGKQATQALSVGSVQVSPDRKKVYLGINGLKDKGYVVHLVASNLKSQSNTDLLYKETWYTLRAISQTDPFTVPVALPRAVWDPANIRILRNGAGKLQVRLPAQGRFRVEIVDMAGHVLARRNGAEWTADFDGSAWGAGLYFLKVSGQGRDMVKTLTF
jgi:hypothetical protein